MIINDAIARRRRDVAARPLTPRTPRDHDVSQQFERGRATDAAARPFGGFLLLGGRLADRCGRRRVFAVGLLVFAAASLASGLAGSQSALVVARAGQGLGAALLIPAALSLVIALFAPGAQRNVALGVWGAAASAGGAVGGVLGGVVTDALGWEWGRFVNVPVARHSRFWRSR